MAIKYIKNAIIILIDCWKTYKKLFGYEKFNNFNVNKSEE